MNKYTLGLSIMIIVIILSLMDAHMPLVTFKFPITKAITIKISLYDNDQAFTKMVLENAKAMIECFKGI